MNPLNRLTATVEQPQIALELVSGENPSQISFVEPFKQGAAGAAFPVEILASAAVWYTLRVILTKLLLVYCNVLGDVAFWE